MSDFRAGEPGRDKELVLGGPLTIENASVIRKKLISALLRENEIVVSIDADAPVDLSFLQLLCSAHRSASKLGKSFRLRHQDFGNFSAAVENSGYARKKGCVHDRYGTCLWAGGRHD
jgi:ABC-type transporter Mla MlaB component